MNNNMGEKLRVNKNKIIVAIILWVIISIVFVAPISASYTEAKITGKALITSFIELFGQKFTNPFGTITQVFSSNYFSDYFSLLWKFTLAYIIVLVIGIVRSMPKHQYQNIEHGSSDWCENGEEYRTLNKNKGILLAQKEYLPVDKRGNVNVLVVGRFRFW